MREIQICLLLLFAAQIFVETESRQHQDSTNYDQNNARFAKSKTSRKTNERKLDEKSVDKHSSNSKGARRKVQDRIVNGTIVEPNSLPFQLALFSRKKFICGASIINKNYALTAAHCVVKQLTNNNLNVYAGKHDRFNFKESRQQHSTVRKIIMHSEYNPDTFAHDIALLELNTPFYFNEFVQPIKLSPSNYDAKGGVYVSGWGTTSEGGYQSRYLQNVKIRIIEHSKCVIMYRVGDILDLIDSQMCAGVPEGGKDACQGDSGGPLVTMEEDQRLLQVGVVSMGEGCAQARYPGIYTDVSKYRNWIEKNMGKIQLI